MNRQNLVFIAAAVAFSLAGVASVNDSEAINVALPSQYRTVWDGSPEPSTGAAAEVVRPALRLSVEGPESGELARNAFRHRPDRG